MPNLKYRSSKRAAVLSVVAIVLFATIASAQNPTDKCRLASVIPLASEPPAKIVIDSFVLDDSPPVFEFS